MADLFAVLTDFVIMAENEIRRIKTGKAPGPSMRDCLGQWEATIREARALIEEHDRRFRAFLENPDGPQAG